MTNTCHAPARDAGAWAKQVLARASKRRRRNGLVQRGRQTRARIHLLVACKLALITAALIIE